MFILLDDSEDQQPSPKTRNTSSGGTRRRVYSVSSAPDAEPARPSIVGSDIDAGFVSLGVVG